MEVEQQPSFGSKRKGVVHRRKWLTLEEKLKIINANDNGKTSGKIAREFGMNESSVRLILRKKDFYKSLGKSPTFHTLKSFAQQRSSLLGEVERQLLEWLNEHKHKRIHLTEAEIQKKALDLFNGIKPEYCVTTKFSASRGWLRRFKNRIKSQKCIQSTDMMSTIEEAVKLFRLEFQKIIKEDGLSYHQIFNVDESVLFWKKMPCSNFAPDLEKDEPSKDKLCLLLGSNAAGDFKLKPLVIYPYETLQALSDCAKDSISVMWRCNKKSWLTKDLFQEWFTIYFCPAVEEYCSDLGLDFKILLVLDPTSCHNITHPHPNVKIIFLPKNISKFLQPMSLGIFPLLKAQYQRLISQNIANSPDQTFWLKFNIKNAIENIHICWTETDAENLAATWYQLLPDVKTKDFESQIAAVAKEIMSIDQQLGIKSNVQNLDTYLDLPSNETPDQYPKFEEITICQEDSAEIYAAENECDDHLNMEHLKRITQNIDAACEIIMMNDSDRERSIKARQCLQEGIRFYRDMYSENCLRRN